MSPSAEDLLSKTELVVHPGPYAVGAWSKAQVSAVYAGILRGNEALAVVVLDDMEATAMLREKTLIELPPPRKVEKGYAVVTLDAVMEWDVVGVLAAVSGALAEAGVSMGAATAFSRDHLLVKADRLDDALAALRSLCGGVTVRD